MERGIPTPSLIVPDAFETKGGNMPKVDSRRVGYNRPLPLPKQNRVSQCHATHQRSSGPVYSPTLAKMTPLFLHSESSIPNNQRPYSKLGIMTGPYFIGCPNPPSPCTMKSAAKLNLPAPPLPPPAPPPPLAPKLPCTISGS